VALISAVLQLLLSLAHGAATFYDRLGHSPTSLAGLIGCHLHGMVRLQRFKSLFHLALGPHSAASTGNRTHS